MKNEITELREEIAKLRERVACLEREAMMNKPLAPAYPQYQPNPFFPNSPYTVTCEVES